ncbi:MAG: hydrogenase formation protein HypD [candidate division FCPU426 bacterium]
MTVSPAPSPGLKAQLLEMHQLARQFGRPVKYMEVCGTHTMAAFRSGLRTLLPESISLLSGPGCPVCVTPADFIDQAVALARLQDVVIVTFGDLLRVPGSRSSLERERAGGAEVRVAYSPLDALAWAAQEPQRRFVFLAIGFETTIPAIAVSVLQAAERRLDNVSFLCALKLMPPALAALLRSPALKLDGLLCPGHVSVMIGPEPYAFLAKSHHLPCVVAGFEPGDMVAGVLMLLRQSCGHRAEVEIQYHRSVKPGGLLRARQLWESVFEPSPSRWRGLGWIPESGLKLRPEFSAWDADRLYPETQVPAAVENPACRCGEVLQALVLPGQCPLFASGCTPEEPQGPCMVSSEGTCAAYYRYGRMASGASAAPERA